MGCSREGFVWRPTQWRLRAFDQSQRRLCRPMIETAATESAGWLWRRDERGRVLRRRTMARRRQRMAQRADDHAAHHAGIAKAHLGLGGMDIDVDILGRDVEEQRQHGMAVARQHVLIGGAHRAVEQLVAYRPAVDEQILAGRRGAVEGGQPGPARQNHALARGVDRHRGGGEVAPQHRGQPLGPCRLGLAARRGQPEQRPALVGQGEGDRGMRHGQALDDILGGAGSPRADFMNFSRAGVAKNRSRTSTRVPNGCAAGTGTPLVPPSTESAQALSAPLGRLVRRSRATAPMEGSASPRKPRVRIWERSSSGSFEVAWRSTAIVSSSGVIPTPSSTTAISAWPPSPSVTSMRAAPASSAFSASSLTTEAGRSTTSPAAMRLTRLGGRRRMGMEGGE